MLTSASDHRVPETSLVVRALDGTGERIERTMKTNRSVLTPSVGRRAAGMPVWMRSAAAIALLAAGVVGGRLSAGASVNPFGVVVAPNFADGVQNAGVTTLRPASLGGEDTFASVDQATAVLSNAQSEYERAS